MRISAAPGESSSVGLQSGNFVCLMERLVSERLVSERASE